MLSKDEIIERLNDVFRDVFDDDTLEVDENTTADDIEDWDSIEHITLIGAVEDEFKMRFKMGEVSGMKDVGEMIGIIEQRGNRLFATYAGERCSFYEFWDFWRRYG